MSELILAVDQGTTGTTVLVVSPKGEVLGRGYYEHPQIFPQPGQVEHDAQVIWQTACDATRDALAAASCAPAEIAAVGITNQRETIVAWSASTGTPFKPTIVWQDRRTTERCEQLIADGFAPEVRGITGLPIDPYFSATKIEWLMQNNTNIAQAADRGDLRLGTIDSWLVWNMTGGERFVTDPSNAARTMLYDIHQGEWSESLCAKFGVPMSALPEVVPSAGIIGSCRGDDFCGITAPVAGIAGDQQSALFGQACLAPGQAKATYGTGAFVLVNSGGSAPTTEALISTIGWGLGNGEEGFGGGVVAGGTAGGAGADGGGGRGAGAGVAGGTPGAGRAASAAVATASPRAMAFTYALEGSVFTAGAAVQWLRDELQIIGSAPETEAIAASVPDSGGVVVVPAFAGYGAPRWNPRARAAILGLTRGAGRAHIVRATLEGVALRVAELVDAMQKEGTAVTELRVDGGMANNDLLLQLQADILGVPVTRPVNVESTSLGAAFLAGLGAGVYASIDQVADTWQADAVFEPAAERAADVAHLKDRFAAAAAAVEAF